MFNIIKINNITGGNIQSVHNYEDAVRIADQFIRDQGRRDLNQKAVAVVCTPENPGIPVYMATLNCVYGIEDFWAHLMQTAPARH